MRDAILASPLTRPHPPLTRPHLQYHIDGPVHREAGAKIDFFRLPTSKVSMLLRFGNLGVYRTWLGKNLAVYQETALAHTKDYSTDWAGEWAGGICRWQIRV